MERTKGYSLVSLPNYGETEKKVVRVFDDGAPIDILGYFSSCDIRNLVCDEKLGLCVEARISGGVGSGWKTVTGLLPLSEPYVDKKHIGHLENKALENMGFSWQLSLVKAKSELGTKFKSPVFEVLQNDNHYNVEGITNFAKIRGLTGFDGQRITLEETRDLVPARMISVLKRDLSFIISSEKKFWYLVIPEKVINIDEYRKQAESIPVFEGYTMDFNKKNFKGSITQKDQELFDWQSVQIIH